MKKIMVRFVLGFILCLCVLLPREACAVEHYAVKIRSLAPPVEKTEGSCRLKKKTCFTTLQLRLPSYPSPLNVAVAVTGSGLEAVFKLGNSPLSTQEQGWSGFGELLNGTKAQTFRIKLYKPSPGVEKDSGIPSFTVIRPANEYIGEVEMTMTPLHHGHPED